MQAPVIVCATEFKLVLVSPWRSILEKEALPEKVKQPPPLPPPHILDQSKAKSKSALFWYIIHASYSDETKRCHSRFNIISLAKMKHILSVTVVLLCI